MVLKREVRTLALVACLKERKCEAAGRAGSGLVVMVDIKLMANTFTFILKRMDLLVRLTLFWERDLPFIKLLVPGIHTFGIRTFDFKHQLKQR